MTKMIPAWENGILKPIEKIDVHRRGLKHKAVSVFILFDTETLLQQRSLQKYHTPGLWANACCTHPHWNETPEDCANRRIKEELGINLHKIMENRHQIEYRADVGNNLIEHELVEIFVLELSEKNEIEFNINPEEVMNTRWINIEKLKQEIQKTPDNFTPWLKIYLNNYAEQIII